MKLNVHQKHANERLAAALKQVKAMWGPGFYRLSADLQDALIRAEMLGEIHRINGMGEAATFRAYVEAMAAAAIQWQGGLSDD